MNYALIRDGIVANIIWLSASNAQDFPSAIATNGLPVRVGDTYTDGSFYHNGEKVLSAVERAQNTISEYESALSEIEVALGV